jgi:hypothetical protein
MSSYLVSRIDIIFIRLHYFHFFRVLRPILSLQFEFYIYRKH